MASSRAVLTPQPGLKQRKPRRQGSLTKSEKALVAQVVMDQPGEITQTQVLGLSRSLRRSPEAIRTMIAEARENFVASAGDYVAIHKQATQNALDAGDNETAMKGAAWAMTNLSGEGQRIVEKQTSEPMGSQVHIAIAVGGIDSLKAPIALPKIGVIDAEN